MNNCTALAHTALKIPVHEIEECQAEMGSLTYAAMRDYHRDCGHRANSAPPNVESIIVQFPPPEANVNVDLHIERSRKLLTATAPQIQPVQNDLVHSIWLNGPTYSGKLDNNRGASANGVLFLFFPFITTTTTPHSPVCVSCVIRCLSGLGFSLCIALSTQRQRPLHQVGRIYQSAFRSSLR